MATEPSRIKSSEDVAAALAAVADYFARREPSNPALLFARQAEQLIGKSLPEIMQMLMPNQFDQAKFLIDKEQAFEIPIGRLAQFDGTQAGAEVPDGGADAPPEADAAATGDAAASAEIAESGPATDGQSIIVDGKDIIVNASAAGAARRIGNEVVTRQAALKLLEEIAAYYRSAEPSSPIALLAERARRLADRDFLGLLKELLPQS